MLFPKASQENGSSFAGRASTRAAARAKRRAQVHSSQPAGPAGAPLQRGCNGRAFLNFGFEIADCRSFVLWIRVLELSYFISCGIFTQTIRK